MRTFTPEIDDGVLRRLAEYAALFAPDFRRTDQARWTEAYLRGLLQDGDRKSVEPLVRRIQLPPQCQCVDPIQAVQHWLNQGSWESERLMPHYRAVMAEAFASEDGRFIFDDTSFVKQGTHSVGVQRQYCGALGKKANCQVAVSLHYATRAGHYPLDLRLHLPESWTSAPARLDECKVPAEHREPKTKHQIALELLDRVRGEGLPGRVALADAGYSSSQFRAGLASRGLTYVVGMKGDEVAFTEEPRWILPEQGARGRKPRRRRLAPDCSSPRTIATIAASLRLRRCTWREGTKGKMAARFARLRVWPGQRWSKGGCYGAPPEWLIVEERGSELRYAFSNAPESASLIQLVRLLKERWPVEQGYQQLKEELGLDHFEGRSWTGFHHHTCFTILAFGFLELERNRMKQAKRAKHRAEKKKQDNRTHRTVRSTCTSGPAIARAPRSGLLPPVRGTAREAMPTVQGRVRKPRPNVTE